MARPTKAWLNLSALRHNAALARELAPHSGLMAVVKADAYGHGAVLMARTLAPSVDAFAVACLEEAMELRESGIEAPILLLEGAFEAAEIIEASKHRLWLTIDNQEQLLWLEKAACPQPLQCWLKIDTGMHRLGIKPEEAAHYYRRLINCPASKGAPVLSTHFACADELASSMTQRQLACFETACAGIAAPRSAANSAGLLAWPQSHFDWVRPGYMLWGNSPFCGQSQANAERLRAVMTLTSAVISVRDVKAGDSVGYGATWRAPRDSRIATVTAGYGDGYPRTAANGTPVLVKGQRAALAGRVSMDMITVDVTDIPDVRAGDPVELWGENLAIDEVASGAGTIAYELLTRMPARPARTPA